ncbi:hypothetical protein TRIATDRAFT_94133 [Trichoderma atroviride IMI 206040]|uniref:Uncharacterized protein n=1 Tax=Hypocrea atroviridis (strain ATCC 20476 / IMI 206040) TaxID=452589 RepID=G9NEV5_HYPAI|nr:uncharacterized protein TRIATDRAFT_94133 [Trichoderma atroviride IMI 206040]EHK50836.1 hypothetical protein TRIATDRAFT_94133 [Trichoderma atroviride IMI 206040]
MLNYDIDVGNEPSLQDSLLTAHDPAAKAKTNPTSTKPDNSLENDISPSSNVPYVSKDYWGWEIFGVLGSAAIIVGIAVILDRFDGKRQPSWEHVSLNSLISWLSTAAKFCLLMPISRGLGQLKWVWFAEKKRPLSDLEEFDSASRSISGSAKLLWRLKGLHFAALGSLTIILASGFDPFIQNLIHYYPNTVSDPSQLAYLANLSTYTAVGPLLGGHLSDVDLGLKANVYNAILNPKASQFWAQPQYICNTGNCTWKPAASIGICPLCADISSDLSVSWNSQENSNVNPLVYKNHTFPLIQAIKALYNDTNQNLAIELTNETHFIATECSLEPCVRSVQPSVIRGIYSESTPTYWLELENRTAGSNSLLHVTLTPPWGSNLGIQEGQSFGIDFYALDALSVHISTLFSGKVHVGSDTLFFNASRPDILQAIFYGHFADCDNPSDKVGCTVNNVAKAMSKSFWDTPYMNYGMEGANMTIGETLVTLTFVRIQWWWLVFPATIWLLSVVTLLGTVWKTRRAQVQVWRNSPFPLILLHRHEDFEANGSYDISTAGLSTRAKKLRVKLHVPEDNIRVTNHSLN